MSSLFHTKKLINVVLIGDHEGNKADFLPFLHTVLAGKGFKKFIEENKAPEPTTKGESSHYLVTCPGDTTVTLVDTPNLTEDGAPEEVEAVKRAICAVETVDAFVVIADRAKNKFGSGVEPVLKMIDSLFARSIRKNIFFLFTAKISDDETLGHRQENLKSWVLKDQVIGPVTDMVAVRSNYQSHPPESRNPTKSQLEKGAKRRWESACDALNRLWKSVDQSAVQATDMKHLYRQAMGIESELYTNIHNTGRPDIDRNTRLIDLYCLVATSPDFVAHVSLLLELVEHEEGTSISEESVKKLGDTYRALEAMKGDEKPYPKMFEISCC